MKWNENGARNLVSMGWRSSFSFQWKKSQRAPTEVASSVIFPLNWLCCFLPPGSLPFGAFCHAAMATLRVNHYPRKFRSTGNKWNRGERKMNFLSLLGGGSCFAALQVWFHVLTLENTQVSYFFFLYLFYFLLTLHIWSLSIFPRLEILYFM